MTCMRARGSDAAAGAAAHLELRHAGGAFVFPARRNARHPARHDRPRAGPALKGIRHGRSIHRCLAAAAGRSVHARSCVRDIESGQSAAALWNALEESGFADALVGEAQGGAGLSLGDVFPLLELCGAYAVPVPLAETMLARALLADAGVERPPRQHRPGPGEPGTGRPDPLRRWCACGRVADWVLVQQGGACRLLPVAQAARSPGVFPLDATLAVDRGGGCRRAAGSRRARPAHAAGLQLRGATGGCADGRVHPHAAVRQRAQPVRPADRQVPGDPAPAQRHFRAHLRGPHGGADRLPCAGRQPRSACGWRWPRRAPAKRRSRWRRSATRSTAPSASPRSSTCSCSRGACMPGARLPAPSPIGTPCWARTLLEPQRGLALDLLRATTDIH